MLFVDDILAWHNKEKKTDTLEELPPRVPKNSGRYPWGPWGSKDGKNPPTTAEYHERIRKMQKIVCDDYLKDNIGTFKLTADQPEYAQILPDNIAYRFFYDNYESWEQFATLALNYDAYATWSLLNYITENFEPADVTKIFTKEKPDLNTILLFCWLCDNAYSVESIVMRYT